MLPGIDRFLDEEGKLKQLPSKKTVRDIAFAYLAEKFEFDRDYTEHEVNAILASCHTFGDHARLRRDLIDEGWLLRTRDGSRYWKNPEKKQEET